MHEFEYSRLSSKYICVQLKDIAMYIAMYISWKGSDD